MDPPFIVEFTDFRLVLEGAKVKTNFKKIDKLQQIQILGWAALHCLWNTSTCCALGQRGRIWGGDDNGDDDGGGGGDDDGGALGRRGRIRGGDGGSLLIGNDQIDCDHDDVDDDKDWIKRKR